MDLSIITPAMADTGFGGDFGFMIPMVAIFAIMYFMLIRPQQKRAQEMKKMREELKCGDRVLMNGGLYGEVAKVIGPEEVSLEIADGVKVRVATSLIGSVVPTGAVNSQPTPASQPEERTIGIEPSRTIDEVKTAPVRKTRATTPKKTTTRKTAAKKTTTKKATSTAKKTTATAAKKKTAAAAKKTTATKTAAKTTKRKTKAA